MKKLFSIKTGLLLGTLVMIAFSSCLKDKKYDEGIIQAVSSKNGVSKVIEIGLTGTSNSNFFVLSLDASNTDTTIDFIPVNLAAPEPASEDINVTLVKNDALVTAYNSANGTTYTVPSASQFSVLNANNVVTIPKGSYTGYLRLKFKPSNFLGGDYAIGYSIGSVDKQGYTISSNLKNGIVAITIKNKYHGNYHANGYFYHPSAPRAINNLAVPVQTVNANTSVTYLGDLGNLIYLTVDPATNKVTISDAGTPPGVSPTAVLTSLPGGYTPFAGSNPSIYNNTYDPATKTFYLRYGYMGASGWRVVEEILKKD